MKQFNRARRPTGLVEQVYEQICDAILLGRFTPGGRLTYLPARRSDACRRDARAQALSRLISEGS